MIKPATIVTLGVVFFFTIVGLSLLLVFPVKWCWNSVMPYLFDLPTITWGKAWCLTFLASVFFKNVTVRGTK